MATKVKSEEKGKFYTRHVIEKQLRHHVVEWSATALSIIGAVLNSNQMISGFYVWSLANILWISFAIKHKHWGLLIMNIVFLCINVWGVVTWRMNPFVILNLI